MAPDHPLQGFLALLVVPHLDWDGIQALRQTSKGIKNIVDSYEKSAAKEKFRSWNLPVKHQKLLFTSHGTTRHVIYCYTYDAIRETEWRERKINYLVDESPYLKLGFQQAGLDDATPEQAACVRDRLKRAIWLSTWLADFEACDYIDIDHVSDNLRRYGARRKECQTWDSNSDVSGSGPFGKPAFRGPVDEEWVRTNQLTAITEDLSVEDLASLSMLSFLAGCAFSERIASANYADLSFTMLKEFCVAVGEAALRHGVFFLNGHAMLAEQGQVAPERRHPLVSKAVEMTADVMEEIRRWETPDPSLSRMPGFNMVVHLQFRDIVQCTVPESRFWAAHLIKGGSLEERRNEGEGNQNENQ